MILPLPEREKIESELRDEILERGDQKSMAGYLRVDPSRVNRQLDPYNADVVSPVFQIMEWLWAMDCKDPRKADRVIEQIVRERNKWLIKNPQASDNSANLTSAIFKSATLLLEAEAGCADTDTILNRSENLRRAVENKSDSLKMKKGASGIFVN